MKRYQILILALIFGLLLASAIAKVFFVKEPVEKPELEYEKLDMAVVPAAVYGIELKKGAEDKEAVRIVKRDDEWIVASRWGARAQSSNVDELLKTVSDIKGELRSKDKDLLSDYGITDDKAFAVLLSDKEGAPLCKLLIGTKSPGYNSCFARRADSFDVYLLNKDLLSVIGVFGDTEAAAVNPSFWIDLSLIKFDIEKVDGVNVMIREDGKARTILNLKREDDKEKGSRWAALTEDAVFDIDAAKVKDHLKRLTTMRTIRNIDPAGGPYGFEEPYMTASLARGADAPLEIVAGGLEKKEGTDRYAKTTEGRVFVVSKPVLDAIASDIANFFADNPLKVDKETVEKIEIAAPGRKKIRLEKELVAKNENYLDKLKTFRLDKALTKKEMPSPQYTLSLYFKDGRVTKLYAAKDKSGAYKAKMEGSPAIFEISKEAFDKVFSDLP